MRSGTYPRPTPQQTLMKFISTLEPTPCPLTFSVSSCTCLSSIATPRRPHCVCQLFRRLPLEWNTTRRWKSSKHTLDIIQAPNAPFCFSKSCPASASPLVPNAAVTQVFVTAEHVFLCLGAHVLGISGSTTKDDRHEIFQKLPAAENWCIGFRCKQEQVLGHMSVDPRSKKCHARKRSASGPMYMYMYVMACLTPQYSFSDSPKMPSWTDSS